MCLCHKGQNSALLHSLLKNKNDKKKHKPQPNVPQKTPHPKLTSQWHYQIVEE